MSEAEKAHRYWRGEDDAAVSKAVAADPNLQSVYSKPADDESRGAYTGVALEAQRIRTFKIFYKEIEGAFLQ